MKERVPRIQLCDYTKGTEAERKAFVKALGDGLCHFGFLAVGGHGLEEELVHDNYNLFQDFFALDEPIKKKYDVVAGGQRGYTPFGVEKAKDQKVPDLKEFWHIGQELPEGHEYRSHYPDNVWPDELPQMKPKTLKLFHQLEECARTLLHALADYFELPQKTFSDMMERGNSIFRVIHYPPLSEAMPVGAIRAAAHEDINLITLLTESKGSGLEILTQDNEWLPVHALEGDIIVDSGDMLSRVTNGVVPATTHRVVNPPGDKNEARYSMPFFVHPFASCDLTVMDRFTSEENPAKWSPITANDFLNQRLAEIGLLK